MHCISPTPDSIRELDGLKDSPIQVVDITTTGRQFGIWMTSRLREAVPATVRVDHTIQDFIADLDDNKCCRSE
jgi:hypothetical protein